MSTLRAPITELDHIKGPPRSDITLVEYGDYQCPFCGDAYWVLRSIEERVRDLRFVFRHFPLGEVHPYAAAAAEAAEAAGEQGQFWPMHDLLYQHQDRLAFDDLLGYAETLELDVDEFADAVVGHHGRERIRRDFLGGVRSGVNGTPCLFINETRYEGALDPIELVHAFEHARRRGTDRHLR